MRLVDGVGVPRRLGQALLTWCSGLEQPALQSTLVGLDRQLRGDLAGAGPAHPVGDDEQRRPRHVGILVGAALPARVGAGEGFGDAQHQPSS